MHIILKAAGLRICDQSFLSEVQLKPVVTIISCYQQQYWHYTVPLTCISFRIHLYKFCFLTAVPLTGLKTANSASRILMILFSVIPHYVHQFHHSQIHCNVYITKQC
jgi:hypothetical protein